MKKLTILLAIPLLLTIVFGTVYATTQQMSRQSANDPQIQLAEDAAARLDQGADPTSVIGGGNVDIAKSLAPFVIVYDTSGHVVAGTGYLDGNIPAVPSGVLTSAQGKPYNAVTWQPQTGVRIASVTVHAKNYSVLSGRSLTEVEKRDNTILLLVTCGWLASLVGFAIAGGIVLRRPAKRA